MKYSPLCLSLFSFFVSGCAATDFLSRNLPAEATADVHIYSRNEEPVLNLIDEALARCPDETEKAETECVRTAVARSTAGVRALASSIPGCAMGSVCTYDHTTRRRLGLIPMYATVIRKDWRVTVDFRRERSVVAALPVTVSDRNVFTVPPAATTGATTAAARTGTAVR